MLRRCAFVFLLSLPNMAYAEPSGFWTNPTRTVRVAVSACGVELCGRVVWAGREATEDAREGGVEPLVGQTLLRAYRRKTSTRWQGRVFVPDWNRTFWSTIDQVDPRTLKISGCILRGLVCKSQLWTKA